LWQLGHKEFNPKRGAPGNFPAFTPCAFSVYTEISQFQHSSIVLIDAFKSSLTDYILEFLCFSVDDSTAWIHRQWSPVFDETVTFVGACG
jgi:hypothetical protein